MKIEGKVVVITGGASGLGQATAEYFANKGAQVAILDVDAVKGRAVVDDMGEARALFCETDVTNEDSVTEALESAMTRFGAIHININCAGVPAPCKVLDRQGRATPLQKFASVINVNLIGMFNVMSKCAEKMTLNNPEGDEERGVIVNVSSGAAFEGQIGQAAYSASKSGVLGLNMPAARELADLGIRINAICPGLFATPLLDALDPKVVEALRQIPESPRRPGQGYEFAHCCAFLVENSYMNGRAVRLDAATVMPAK